MINNLGVTRNRKGDIPITILVIGIFAVCGFALLSFLAANIELKDSLTGIGSMEEMNIQIEKNLMGDAPVKSLYIEKNESSWNPLKEEKVIFSINYTSVP